MRSPASGKRGIGRRTPPSRCLPKTWRAPLHRAAADLADSHRAQHFDQLAVPGAHQVYDPLRRVLGAGGADLSRTRIARCARAARVPADPAPQATSSAVSTATRSAPQMIALAICSARAIPPGDNESHLVPYPSFTSRPCSSRRASLICRPGRPLSSRSRPCKSVQRWNTLMPTRASSRMRPAAAGRAASAPRQSHSG